MPVSSPSEQRGEVSVKCRRQARLRTRLKVRNTRGISKRPLIRPPVPPPRCAAQTPPAPAPPGAAPPPPAGTAAAWSPPSPPPPPA
eukprot:1191488-Prorocentrum_minimum.AAC.2